MTTVIRLPKMGLTMEEATINQWFVEVGGFYHKGDLLATVETDKSTLEVEMPEDGTIIELMATVGDQVDVGAPIAKLQNGEERKTPETPSEVAVITPDLIRISPSARRRAIELGVDYKFIQGTGPKGRIIHQDIEDACQLQQVSVPPTKESNVRHEPAGQVIKLTPMRRAIARRMTESVQTVPQFFIQRKVDLTALLAYKELVQGLVSKSKHIKLSINDFLIQATAKALIDNRLMNASFIGRPEDKDAYILQHESSHIGLAVSTDSGLLVPVIKHADQMTLVEIAKERDRLITASRDNKLQEEERTGGTFTISNLGLMDVDEFTAIVNPPEAGILAVGSIRNEPYIAEGTETISVRSVMNIVGSFDHRVVDGLYAAKFMKDVVRQLESEEWMLF